MNNSVYGNTIVSVRPRSDIQLENNAKRIKRLVEAPAFKSFKVYNENLSEIQRIKQIVAIKKLFQTLFVIVKSSKLYRSKFHYNFNKSTYGEKVHPLFRDID